MCWFLYIPYQFWLIMMPLSMRNARMMRDFNHGRKMFLSISSKLNVETSAHKFQNAKQNCLTDFDLCIKCIFISRRKNIIFAYE